MPLFSKDEIEKLQSIFSKTKGHILLTFRQNHGPTKLRREWIALMKSMGEPVDCLSWWSSSGNMGLLECESQDSRHVFGQWVLADVTELVGLFEIEDDDLVSIRDGFDSGNVVSAEMRAIRIGETGGELE